MNRLRLLGLAALGLALLTLAAAVAIPGAMADREEPVRPAEVDIRDSTVTAGSVTGETVALHVEHRLRHRGGPATNVTIEIRAIDDESGMLAERARIELGTLADAREYNATLEVPVPREGGYRLDTLVYVDGERRTGARQSVSGVGTLVPDYARSGVEFRYTTGFRTSVPPILYQIERVEDGRATLAMTPTLTNTGDEPERDMELVVLARQADSNIVAARDTVPVGSIGPGQSVQPPLSLTVPDDYNYHLDAMLRRDGVVVAATSVAASLDPTETIPQNETTREVGIETSDFETAPETDAPSREATPAPGGSGPGFGIAVALVALLGLGFGIRRRQA